MGLVHKTSSFLLATPGGGGEGGGYSGASVATVLLKQTVENKLFKNEAPITVTCIKEITKTVRNNNTDLKIQQKVCASFNYSMSH